MIKPKTKTCLDCGKLILLISIYCRSCASKRRIRKTGMKYVIKNINPAWFKKGHPSNKGRTFPEFTGSKHHNWNGGKQKNPYGYIQIQIKNHPLADNRGRIFEHRFIMEQAINRYLNQDEVVHHINHIRADNRIENLQLFPNHSEHMKYHAKIKKATL